jgi:hypothetical protein
MNKNAEIPLWITKPWNIIQKTAAKIITACFKTVSNSIAEAEAGIKPLDVQLQKRILQHWINCHTLPRDHPFWQYRSAIIGKEDQHRSPFTILARLYPIKLKQVKIIALFPAKPYQSGWGDSEKSG